MKIRFGCNGFTMIELLVVVSIIGLLTSIALASMAEARAKAREARNFMMLKSMAQALEMYRQDHGDWPSKAGDGRMSVSNAPGGGWNVFYAMIEKYMPNVTVNDFPYVVTGSIVTSGVTYIKGTNSNPIQVEMNDSGAGVYIGCQVAKSGFILSIIVPKQTYLTKNDHGFDPDALDLFDGDAYLNPSMPQGSCGTLPTIY